MNSHAWLRNEKCLQKISHYLTDFFCFLRNYSYTWVSCNSMQPSLVVQTPQAVSSATSSSSAPTRLWSTWSTITNRSRHSQLLSQVSLENSLFLSIKTNSKLIFSTPSRRSLPQRSIQPRKKTICQSPLPSLREKLCQRRFLTEALGLSSGNKPAREQPSDVAVLGLSSSFYTWSWWVNLKQAKTSIL